MGDRTNVTLTIPLEFKETIEILDGNFYDEFTVEGNAHLTYEDVNWGELPFLDTLLGLGIPYDNSWNSGGIYGSGTRSLRFTEKGEAIIKEVSDDYLNPDLNTLMARIDDYKKLREYILEFKKEIDVLPWDNQVVYGKLYRTRQLISPTQ